MISLDALVTESLDTLILRCHPGFDEIAAINILRDVLSEDAIVRRSAEGIKINSGYIGLLQHADPALDIRWTIAAHRYVSNRKRVHQAYPAVQSALKKLKAGGPKLAREMVSDSEGLNILDDHQIVNIAAMTLPGSFGICLFDEQGAGKTVSLIFAYDLLAARAEVDQLLIVAPKSMVPEWPKDFAQFRPDIYRVATISGSSKEKLAALRTRSDVYVTNFETAVSFESNFEALLQSRPNRTVLVIDESFLIKSPNAKRTRTLRRLREWCDRAFVLCGTPAPNAPNDVVEQFRLVDFGVSFDGVSLPKDREQAAPVTRRIIERKCLYIRHLKSEVLPNLPSRTFNRIYLPLGPKQNQIYKSLRDSLIADLQATSDIEFRRNYKAFLARRTALLQVCSNPISVVEGYDETPSKLLFLDDFLDRWIRQRDEKVVLWSFYTASIDAIVERYSTQYGAVRYDGTVSNVVERSNAVNLFQKKKSKVRLFIGNPAAAGAGLTLHQARVAIYESMSNQGAHYLQSLDRIHRRGQTREVEYAVLLCQDTIEIAEYERLLGKQKMAGDLLRDAATGFITRKEFIGNLTGGT